MLLVDHDQAQVGHRRERRRARPDRDPGLARAQPPPLVVARPRRHPRVQQRHRIAEAAPEAVDRLRRQRDLGDQHDRAQAALQRRLGGREVDLGLARAGDAVQQPLAAVAAARRRSPPAARCWAAFSSTPSLTAPTASDAGARRRSTSRVATSPRASSRRIVARSAPAPLASVAGGLRARRERAQHRALAQPQALPLGQRALPRLGALDLELDQRPHPPGLRSGAGARRQHQPEPARGSRAVLLPDPAPELDQLRRHPGLERLDRLGEPLGRQLAGLGEPDDDPLHPAAPEGNDQDRAHLHVRPSTRAGGSRTAPGRSGW